MLDEMEDGKPAGRVSVFEAVNETLREFFIGTTTLPGDPPALAEAVVTRDLAHWQKDHKISCRIVETGLAFDEALKFVERHAFAAARTGWTVLTR